MKVGVIGSGAIGPDLAYGFVSALANEKDSYVVLHDIKESALESGMNRIKKYVKKGLLRGKISARQAASIESKLRASLDINSLKDCDYVLEAATEDLKIKKIILNQLEDIVSKDCLIGFATSGIPRRQIVAETRHPERCFVNHPFYPAWRALPIEIVLSEDAALGEKMIKIMKRLGKVPVITADVECFAADDIFCNYCSEAARLVEEGIASPAQIDEIVNNAIGGGGPLNVLDLTRGNLLTAKCQILMRDAETGGKWFTPPEILYTQGDKLWHESRQSPAPYSEETKTTVLNRILAVLLSRTLFVLEKGICDATNLNWLTRMALGFRKGLLQLAQEMGKEEVYRLCREFGHTDGGFYIPLSVQGDNDIPAFYQNIVVERQSDIATVTIYRPEVKNALNTQTIAELEQAFGSLKNDKNLKGVVLTGFEGALVGADIGDLSKLKTQEQGEATCHRGQALLNEIAAFDKPVVAAVNGPIMGGGAEISMACHERVVGPNLLLSQPEVNLGLIPGYGGSQRLPRIISLENALEMLRTGKSINAKTAHEWGWASELTTSYLETAREQIEKHHRGEKLISPLDPSPMQLPESFPPVSIGHRSRKIDAILLDVLRRGLTQNLSDGLKLEAQGVGRAVVTVDFDIGIKNFFQNGPRVPAVFLHE